jgi:hypothetical protein
VELEFHTITDDVNPQVEVRISDGPDPVEGQVVVFGR